MNRDDVLKVTPAQNGQRLDVVLAAARPEFSRAYWQKRIRAGGVRVEEQSATPRLKVETGQQICIKAVIPADAGIHVDPGFRRGDGLKANILFEDADLLVLNKPAGLVTHPAPSVKGLTVVDWLKDHLGPARQAFPDPDRLGLVHRLDKDTTGVLVVAKTPQAQAALSRQFQDRTVRKTYTAIVEGRVANDEGFISAPVGRSRQDPRRMAVSGSGRTAETVFEVLERFREVTLMHWFPKTGRTHQIRVHAAALGHPIVGDTTYGAQTRWADAGIHRPLLHAEQLEFDHPRTGRRKVLKAPRPHDFEAALRRFRRLAAAVALAFLASWPAPAETTSAPSRKSATAKKSAKSAPGDTAGLRQLRGDMANLRSEMQSLNDQLGQLAGALEQLNVANRLRDLEKSIVELNNKASGGAATAEESKTQWLDAARRLKGQEEALGTLRDQLDRFQQELIQLKTRLEASAAAESGPPRP